MKHNVVAFLSVIAALACAGIAAAAEPKEASPEEQIALLKQLRKEKKYGEAMKILDEMIGLVTRKEPIPKLRGWAFTNLEVRKEKAMMMEEFAALVPKVRLFGVHLGIYFWGNAVQEWVAIMRALTPTKNELLCLELYVEQKRCTLMAYGNLGTAATKGNKQDVDTKFRQLSQDFQDVLRTPNLPTKVRERT